MIYQLMNILLYLRQARESIRANKLRSWLSLLGIVIGIMSFVVMLALGEWVKQAMLNDMWQDADVMTIMPQRGQDDAAVSTVDLFEPQILDAIREKVPGIASLWPIYESKWVSIEYGDKSSTYTLYPIQSGYFQYKQLQKQSGSFFAPEEYDQHSAVVVIGHKLAQQLLKGENPLGKQLMIGHRVATVIGVLAEKNRQVDESLYIPETTFAQWYGSVSVANVEIKSIDTKTVEQTKSYLLHYMKKRSKLQSGQKLGYTVRTNKESLKQIGEMMNKFSLLLWWIGAIALIVWWIGIMNIMLVSVTERTREIGIKKAIGATNNIVLMQFLIESIVLTIIGSLIAIWLSYLVVMLMDKYIPDMSPIISIQVVMLAVGVATMMGIVFGLMPAKKAAKLKIIDALRYE